MNNFLEIESKEIAMASGLNAKNYSICAIALMSILRIFTKRKMSKILGSAACDERRGKGGTAY